MPQPVQLRSPTAAIDSHHAPIPSQPRPNPHSPCGTVLPTSRGFLPWRLSDTGPPACGAVREGPASETLHMFGRLILSITRQEFTRKLPSAPSTRSVPRTATLFVASVVDCPLGVCRQSSRGAGSSTQSSRQGKRLLAPILSPDPRQSTGRRRKRTSRPSCKPSHIG